ncbi:unnamed protein product [Periconia digitata]|uniref:GH16 domain-containing protein n=1 Tax=Periconia digitata TaxID=1303443 RepID=A0A9W4UQ89_9PLEO|nr:unnamed protein product [Periconia digitata]
MRPTISSTVLAALTTLSLPCVSTAQQQYTLKDDLSYKNFFNSFEFFSGPDPTNGFVQYQTREAAVKDNLVGYLNDTESVFMGVDHTTKDAKGRASVRLESKQTWNQGLLIADINHMPDSTCGTWPAFWLLGVGPEKNSSSWPNFGEIDLLEGVNDETNNAVTLHTSEGCTIANAVGGGNSGNNNNSSTSAGAAADSSASAGFMGSVSTPNCDVNAKNQDKNVGCSIKAPASRADFATYGTDFNTAGGGVYAMEWTTSSISVWFFPRNSSSMAAVSPPSNNGTAASPASLDPSTFGKPLAKFSGPGCDYEKKFDSMKVIFNTALCGDWAGKEWEKSCQAKTGAATCEEYVENNPEAFADAYWEVKGLKWYQAAAAAAAQDKAAAPAGKMKRFNWSA